MSIRAPEILIKQPAESRLYAIDFAALLAEGESLSGTPVVSCAPSGPTVGAAEISGTTVEFRLSGGTAGARYVLQCVVATSAGNTLAGDGQLLVED